jgi:hypothetical protein
MAMNSAAIVAAQSGSATHHVYCQSSGLHLLNLRNSTNYMMSGIVFLHFVHILAQLFPNSAFQNDTGLHENFKVWCMDSYVRPTTDNGESTSSHFTARTALSMSS